MEAARHLTPVPDGTKHEQVARDIAQGILVIDPKQGQIAGDARDTIAGLLETIKNQARKIGSLERRITEEEDPLSHAKGTEIIGLIERWKIATGHPKSKTSADRVKLIKSRLRDGYSVEQIELAIDGLASHPFVVNAQRRAEGKDSQRYDQLEHCLKGGQKLEQFAVLGHQARQAGLVTWGES